MYLFFTISGFLFVNITSIIIDYIYDIFPINKITIFLKPLGDTFFNQINISLFPILLWSYIELPILITNKYFFVSILSNSLISCIVIYIIKNSSYLINKKTQYVTDGFAIIVATIFGQLFQYLVLLLGSEQAKYPIIQFICIVGYSILFVFIRNRPNKKSLL